MAKKKRTRNRATTPVERVTGHAHAEVIIRDVPSTSFNPRYVDPISGEAHKGNPRYEKAHVNCKESPAAYWFYHDMIDQAQYRMADNIRLWFEMAGGSGASAIDYERVKVDTSGVQDPISDRRLMAADNLKQVSRHLNDEALYDDVHAICAQLIPLSQRWPSSRARSIRAKEVQAALSYLAGKFGYGMPKYG